MMIFYILFLHIINGIQLEVLATSQTQESNGPSTCFNTKMMCDYRGGMEESSPLVPSLESSCIPNECDTIIYSRFQIDSMQQIDVDFKAIEMVKSLNKPVIVSLKRKNDYVDWVDLLSENGNEEDAKVLCDFACQYGIDGFILRSIAPRCYETLNSNFAKYLPAYLKQLKCHENFIIGVSVEGFSAFIKNPCVYDFANMNSLVDFYELNTFGLNKCDPTLYNGRVPLLTRKHGANYLSSMEEVGTFAKASQICYSKVVYAIEMFPINSENLKLYTSYNEVCSGSIQCDKWCVQTTKDLYDKAAFIKKENCGVIVKWVELDDVQNGCGCGSFIGFKNILAGYTGGQLQSCAKFDIQANFLNVPE